MTEGVQSGWLMKAEPESRIVKGKDVAFSATDFEKAGVEHWDGVRNHEAKNLMRDRMKIGDPVLFYHSNCQTPGIAAIARVHRAGYPDFTAFDPSHPYHDPKSSESSPTWYMVDVEFVSHLTHFVPLKLLQALTATTSPIPHPEYLTPEDLSAIREMALLNRGRLSVQPVSLQAFAAIKLLGERGGWEDPSVATQSSAKRKSTSHHAPQSKKAKPSASLQSIAQPSTDTSIGSSETPRRKSKRRTQG